MSIWEKLASAITQSSIGASIGPLLGGTAHNQKHDQGDTPVDNEVPFTVGVIALSAKIAKADGVVTRDEVKAFKEAFRVSDGEMKHAARVFNLAKEEVTGYEAFADELVTIFKGNRKLLEDVLEGLFHIAKADETFHPREARFLREVAKRFGITDTEFNYIKARHLVSAERNPYDVLGVKPTVSDEELENQYRRLIADNSPEELMARGVPREFVTIATERVAAITEAYDALVKQRRPSSVSPVASAERA
jgi:DnaJ like chaperone protein